ncbi:rhoptry neck protein 2 [Plasmodium vivax]|uniref:Rhoptry neck protein 2 n=1 Tax=Plasmodium vivax TaxID=5855 RepID=A0A565A0S7_PLAVI|nr:rhoptry neck protein 2 [Plasmodium vivax]
MLKIIFLILLIFARIDSISTREAKGSVRDGKQYVKTKSPTYTPQKKTKVIFYMPGQEQEEEEDDNDPNGSKKNGKSDTGANKGTHMGSKTDAGNSPSGLNKGSGVGSGSRPASNNYKGNAGGGINIDMSPHGDNSNKGQQGNAGLNKNQEDTLRDEYEKIRKQEEEEEERINNQRRADMKRAQRGKNKFGDDKGVQDSLPHTKYELSNPQAGPTNPNAKNRGTGVYDEFGNGPYNLVGKQSGGLTPTAPPYEHYGEHGAEGKGYGPYGGAEGKGYGPYGGSDGKGYGTYGGADGKGYGPYGGSDGKGYGPYGGSDGKGYGPYGGSDGKGYGPYGGADRKGYGPDGTAGSAYHGGYDDGTNPTYRSHLNVNLRDGKGDHDGKNGMEGYPNYFKKHFRPGDAKGAGTDGNESGTYGVAPGEGGYGKNKGTGADGQNGTEAGGQNGSGTDAQNGSGPHGHSGVGPTTYGVDFGKSGGGRGNGGGPGEEGENKTNPSYDGGYEKNSGPEKHGENGTPYYVEHPDENDGSGTTTYGLDHGKNGGTQGGHGQDGLGEGGHGQDGHGQGGYGQGGYGKGGHGEGGYGKGGHGEGGYGNGGPGEGGYGNGGHGEGGYGNGGPGEGGYGNGGHGEGGYGQGGHGHGGHGHGGHGQGGYGQSGHGQGGYGHGGYGQNHPGSANGAGTHPMHSNGRSSVPSLEYIHGLRPVNAGDGQGVYGGNGINNPLVYHVQHGVNIPNSNSDKKASDHTPDEDEDTYGRTRNKRYMHRNPGGKYKGSNSPHDSNDDSGDTEYELNEGDVKRLTPKNKKGATTEEVDTYPYGKKTNGSEFPRMNGSETGHYGSNNTGSGDHNDENGYTPIIVKYDNTHAKNRANEIEENLNKGEYSRIKMAKGKKGQKSGGYESDGEDSDVDSSNVFYVDNGQDMLIKEKMSRSEGPDEMSEEGLNVKYKAQRGPVNYHFSNYMNLDKRNTLSSNEIELQKMIGPKFSEEVNKYCRLNEPSSKKGEFLNVSFEYSRALEELRSEMINELQKRKAVGSNYYNNILNAIYTSMNRKNANFGRDAYEDKSFISEANSFRNEEMQPLSAKYNKILRQYLCHVFVGNPGVNQLERLYFHNLALGELIEPIRRKYNKLASSSVGLNYEIYIASSSNIYLMGHLLMLSLAYLSYNSYFVQGLKPFYSLETMLMANSDYSFFMYNEVCNVYYHPKGTFNKDITFIPIESRPGRHSTYVGERKVTCDLLELILNAYTLINVHEIQKVFNTSEAYGYENSISFGHNAVRIFSQVCPRDDAKNTFGCDFEKSTLYNSKVLKMDEGDKENQRSLKRAFDMLRTFAEIESTSHLGDPSPNYISLIFEQNLYTDFYKYLFWYDNRELINVQIRNAGRRKKGKKVKFVYDEFVKRGKQLKDKLIKIDAKYNARSKALLVFYALVDKYANIFRKSENVRKFFLNDVSSIRHHLYLNSVLTKSPKSNLDSMKKTLEELQSLTNAPLKFIVRGNNLKFLNNVAKFENLFYVNLFIMSSLSRKDPVKSYYSEKKKMLTATRAEKFATSTSALIPHKLRKLVVTMKKGLLKKKLLTALAKMKLLQHIPANLLENILTTIRFTTHTIATREIIQNAKYMPKNLTFYQNRNVELAKQVFADGGFAKYADNLMSTWFTKGFEEFKREKIEKQKMEYSIEKELKEASNNDSSASEEITEQEKLQQEQNELNEEKERQRQENKLIFNQNDKWDQYINKEFAKALGIWLELSDNAYNKDSFIYRVVEDSKYLLESNIEDNIMFSRTVKPTKQTAFRKFFKKIISLGNMLLRKPSFKVEHAIWFGATINMKKAMMLLEKVAELHKLLRNEDESWLINEAFIEIVDHVVLISSEKRLREPFSVARNPGMVAINPAYAQLNNEERMKELQNSMCADHCSALWKTISTFALQHLKNPESLHSYESKFSKNSFGNKIDDQNFVNNFKMILGGDAVLHYFDVLLPKSMKKELKAMKNGVSLSSAFSLKLTKIIFSELQLPYLSQMFYTQAPYFGHFIGKWQKEREKSRMKEILGFMTLGTLSAYTILSAMDISQHATDIGMGPATSCYTSTIPPPKQVCIQQAVKATLTSSTQACMKSVFSVGLFASIGPYLFAPMAGLAVWNVLKSEFKVLQRVDMALKSVFKNMWRKFLSIKGIRKLKYIFKRRKTMKKKIIEKAEHKMLEMKNNPEMAKNHKLAVQKMHKHASGSYHYISYARIQV